MCNVRGPILWGHDVCATDQSMDQSYGSLQRTKTMYDGILIREFSPVNWSKQPGSSGRTVCIPLGNDRNFARP